MEHVNISSIKINNNVFSQEMRKGLLARFDSVTLANYIITTDELEILSGQELIEKAYKEGKKTLPLKRISVIKNTTNFPKRVLLELTSKCNSYCTMCPRNILTREEKHMDTQLAKSVIKQLAEVGISGLWLYNIGESLLHPDFFEILDYCRSFDTLGTIWLSTNGEIFDKNIQEKLLEYPVDILNYSVNAMSEDNYKKIAPNLDFYRVQNNLKNFVELKRQENKFKPVIRAQMIEFPDMNSEIHDFMDKYGDKVDIVSINKLELFSQNVCNDNSKETITNNKIKKCNRIDREDFMIFSDGSVSCCDTDFNCTFNLGNVKESSISEIYNGKKYQDLIKKYQEGRLHEQELCSKCLDYNL
ncbi:MAG: hypothetical protein A2255_00470 [Candidatus Melainabacteria bacterium RIFOXYA2_FULL_32_9]|nr:MAG: hypothetical protein A2255_00470 [Candidatus Melainabacteria bacterium RIFOXYA2_FULL_32_9]